MKSALIVVGDDYAIKFNYGNTYRRATVLAVGKEYPGRPIMATVRIHGVENGYSGERVDREAKILPQAVIRPWAEQAEVNAAKAIADAAAKVARDAAKARLDQLRDAASAALVMRGWNRLDDRADKVTFTFDGLLKLLGEPVPDPPTTEQVPA